MIRTQNIDQIFYLAPDDFEKKALDFFLHQADHSPFYKKYLATIAKDFMQVNSVGGIPFLPIGFFKSQKIFTNEVEKMAHESEPLLFESSGTSGTTPSQHHVIDFLLYEKSFVENFETFFGKIEEYCFLALLPSYLEKGNSSLVYMVDYFIKNSQHPLSHFYLNNQDELSAHLSKLEAVGQKTILWGVTYALLYFAEKFPQHLKHTLLIETGGMKGRRQEMIRDEVHEKLIAAFDLTTIHAEYGMTELLSQAYSLGGGIFKCPAWMKVLVRDMNDPFQISFCGKGLLNIIDLANIHSCCFIATEDIGEVFADGSFTVTGRLDNSDLRGCSLMYEN